MRLQNKVCIVTGGGGVLGGAIAEAFAKEGASVVLLGRTMSSLVAKKEEIKETSNNEKILTISCDVLSEKELQNAKLQILDAFGTIDVLVNAAGGNRKGATIAPGETFFDLKLEDFKAVNDLNLMGTVLPSYAFGEVMAGKKNGAILNVSSMAADRVITRVIGYSASKAAIDNFTKSLAVEMALKFGEGIRVNAIAPGFFVGEQNRSLLLNEDGSYTDRGKTIISGTPMKRFGNKEEIQAACVFLCSEEASFITGTVLPIDGGFSAFSGV
ncbi:MAG: SDR family oxidoreductase [Balneolales bacterium]|nr:SDR family oxidoreductase [Balneolales bacterium]